MKRAIRVSKNKAKRAAGFQRRLLFLAAFLIPPFALLGWILFGSKTLGNDYTIMSIPSLIYRYYLSIGIEPTWYPHIEGGQSFGFIFYAQPYYFPAWLLSHMLGYQSGHALDWFTVKSLVLLATAQLVMAWAIRKSTGSRWTSSFIVSFLAIYNLRTLDAFRYMIYLDTVVYYICLMCISVVYLVEGDIRLLLGLALASVLMFSSGYWPVYIFGSVGFVAIFALSRRYLLQKSKGHFYLRWAQLSAAIVLGAGLAAPSWLMNIEGALVNYQRMAAADFYWADFAHMTVWSFLGNLFRPWDAEVHSAFGANSVFSVAAISGVILLITRPRWVFPVALAALLGVLYALGSDGPIFELIFRNVPGFGTLRIPGRILSVILPVVVLFGVGAVRGLWLKEPKAVLHAAKIGLQVSIAVLAMELLFIMVDFHSWEGAKESFSVSAVNPNWTPVVTMAWTALGILGCASILILMKQRLKSLSYVAAIAFLLQTALCLRYGSWEEARVPSTSFREIAAAEHLPLFATRPLWQAKGFRPWDFGFATQQFARFVRSASDPDFFLPLTDSPNQRVKVPFYLTDRVRCFPDLQDEWKAIRSCSSATCEATALMVGPQAGLCGASSSSLSSLVDLNRGNKLHHLGPHSMEMEVSATKPALFITPYPLISGWQAWLDDRRVEVLPVADSFGGVVVGPGIHRIRMVFHSRAQEIGISIALASLLAFIGLAISARFERSIPTVRKCLVVLVGAVILASLLDPFLEANLQAAVELPSDLKQSYSALLERQLRVWGKGRE